jgi:hypothetical protein
VDLAVSAPVEVRREYLRGGAQRADRCVVDLSPATFTAQSHSVFALSAGAIEKVRLSQFHQGVVRVVLDLRGTHDCRVVDGAEPGRLTLAVGGGRVTPSVVEPKKETPPAPQARENKASAPAQESRQAVELPQVDNWQLVRDPELEAVSAAKEVLASPEEPIVPEQAQTKPAVEAEAALMPPTEPSKTEQPLAAAEALSKPVAQEERVEPGAVAETNANPEPFFNEHYRGGGEIVQEVWRILMGVSLLVAFFTGGGVVFLWTKRKRKPQPEKAEKSVKGSEWDGRMAYLEEAVNRAGVLNSSFFHSLEVSQKRLEALLTQADLAEQNLRRLVQQAVMVDGKSNGRAADSFATASSLLDEGEDVQQVARVLKLPVAQVRLLQELRQSMSEEKTAGEQEKFAEAPSGRSLVAGLKSFVTQLNGASRDGTSLAHNR